MLRGNRERDSALDWSVVSIVFNNADLKGFYSRVAGRIALAQNGAKKLKVGAKKGKQLASKCIQYLGSHPSLLMILFCSQIHGFVPDKSDPLTNTCSEWLLVVVTGGAAWDDRVLFTLYIFGLLRQSAAVRLITPGDASYDGFCFVDTPEKLGKFISLQDTITWTQMLTQEMSKRVFLRKNI